MTKQGAEETEMQLSLEKTQEVRRLQAEVAAAERDGSEKVEEMSRERKLEVEKLQREASEELNTAAFEHETHMRQVWRSRL